MALVTAPLLSMDASGAVGGAVVFSKWKGRNYVRALVKPSNPKSGGQVGVRAMFAFLSQEWKNILPADQATWEDIAEAASFLPFNAYQQNGLLRNRNFLAPTQAYPAAQAMLVDTIGTFTATAGVRQITIEIDDSDTAGDNWGFLIFRSTGTGFTPAFDNLVHVLPRPAAGSLFFVDTPLVPDTYYYDAKPFTKDAVLGVLKGEINATVV